MLALLKKKGRIIM